jgi:hypothetical protein
MSYSLEFHFKPAVARDRVLRYFGPRKRFRFTKDDVLFYEHQDTGAYFFVRLRCARDILLRKNVVSVEFEVNYNRPIFFGIEAEKELSEFVLTFQPRIEDPQMYGMGEGPYTREAFLKAWNFGNLFAVRNRLSNPDGTILSMSGDALHAAWDWNYQRELRDRLNHRCTVPKIMFGRVAGSPSSFVIWPQGDPILLPKVDYVLIARIVVGEPQFGLAPWSEVLEIVRCAGFDTMQDPLKLDYGAAPPSIANWVDTIPPIDRDAFKRERLEPYQILDDKVIAAARESIERSPGDLWIAPDV